MPEPTQTNAANTTTNNTANAKTTNQHRSVQDSPWKTVLGDNFRFFIVFFFAKIYEEIDWERGYEQLDTELANLKKGNMTGKRLADKLIKVYLKSGEELWVLIHLEIQGRRQIDFSQRMFVYNYLISHKYKHDVVSLAVLTDGNRNFRPYKYEKQQWGCHLLFEFPIVKILDYKGEEDELEASDNPFALVVLAHLKSLQYSLKRKPKERLRWKVELTRLLSRKGYSPEQKDQFFQFIDWVMNLTPEDEEEYVAIVSADEEVAKMPYVTSYERIRGEQLKEEGLQQGLQQSRLEILTRQLNRKFGQAVTNETQTQIKNLPSEKQLELSEALLDFTSGEDLTNWLATNQ